MRHANATDWRRSLGVDHTLPSDADICSRFKVVHPRFAVVLRSKRNAQDSLYLMTTALKGSALILTWACNFAAKSKTSLVPNGSGCCIFPEVYYCWSCRLALCGTVFRKLCHRIPLVTLLSDTTGSPFEPDFVTRLHARVLPGSGLCLPFCPVWWKPEYIKDTSGRIVRDLPTDQSSAVGKVIPTRRHHTPVLMPVSAPLSRRAACGVEVCCIFPQRRLPSHRATGSLDSGNFPESPIPLN